jgi:hypothetical protein
MVDMISVGKEFATFVTIEPIMKFGLIPFVEMIEMIKPAWVNVGADSQNREIPEPSALEIEALLDALSKITVVEKKNNLKRLFPGKP